MKRSELKKGVQLINSDGTYTTRGIEFEEWINYTSFFDTSGRIWYFDGEEDINFKTPIQGIENNKVIDCRAETNYVHFKVAPYALNDVAKALTISEIEFSVTKEDNDLIIRYKL